MSGDRAKLATDERRDLAAFLDELAPGDWQAPTLCTEWTVHDVVAHMYSYEELSPLGLVATFVRGGLRPGPVNEVAMRPFADLSPTDLVARVRRFERPAGLSAMAGGAVALTDGLIHHQDIRRALGRPRDIPPDRVVAALDVAAGSPTLPSRGNRRGLRLVATDLDWSRGSGPEVTGPGEAVLMAMAGRPDALRDLDGPGLATLRGRLSPAS